MKTERKEFKGWVRKEHLKGLSQTSVRYYTVVQNYDGPEVDGCYPCTIIIEVPIKPVTRDEIIEFLKCSPYRDANDLLRKILSAGIEQPREEYDI